MKATDFLNQVSKIDRMIANKLEEMEQWQTMAEGITAPIRSDRVQASGDQQKMEKAAIEYLTIEGELQSEIDLLKKARRDVIEVIEQLSASQYDVMHKAYIQGLTFQQIADQQGKTRSGVSNIYRKAIKNVQTILDRREHGKLGKRLDGQG